MPKLKATLLTGRTIDQGTERERGKFSEEYRRSVTICEIDPDDMKRLGVTENDNVRVSTDSGSVILRAVKSARAPHPDVIFVPYGPWASLIMNSETHGTGMPLLKGLPAEVEQAPEEKILSLRELLEKHYKREHE
ncbi:MAG: molybdopterin dinucleotide-binding protein [Candidatus Bathyarchaeota archaeon]|nr:MAG: molybdopterin dinucleotide-binding protein [Candidatus Bathyarchaeota archaeon]